MSQSSAGPVGVAVVWNQFGLGIEPVVGFPATESDRQKAATETGKAVLLMTKASRSQRALFTHLAQTAADNRYFSPDARWIETILAATQDLSEADINKVQELNWTPRTVTIHELKKEIEGVLKNPG